MSCRRCASSPAPTRSSTARSCSPPAIPTSRATGSCSHGWACAPRARQHPPPPAPAAARSPASRPARRALQPLASKRGVPALGAALARLEAAHLRRERLTVEGFAADARRVLRLAGGRELVDFSSNDYLGLARHPALAAAMGACAARAGAGSGASHLITGHGAEHARLCGAQLRRYPHADAAAAERLAAAAPARTALIGSDGVFSMDGDLAPLPQLARVATAHGSWLVVDHAHGLGVIGASGRGTLEHFGLDEAQVPVLIGTLGKAFGSFGAFVAGPAELIEF